VLNYFSHQKALARAFGTILNMQQTKILLVEDEFIVAELMKDVLEGIGFSDCRHAASVPDALSALCEEGWRGALLDISLAGTLVFPVAEALAQRGLPFAFCSGNGDQAQSPEAFSSTPVLPKPWAAGDLERLAADLFGASPG
jgi:CheY-like chemotaxis protein